MNEIRWYKGKYRVEILKRSKGNYLVKVLEDFSQPVGYGWEWDFYEGEEFVTVPRLLWRKPRK